MPDNHSTYYDREAIAQAAASNQHREVIGGLWDEVGTLQIEFLKERGLTPQNQLLDIGCGSLRLGVKAVAYLDAGHYWGTDLNESLLKAGYEKEIVAAQLASKLPRQNLVVDGKFTFAGVPHEIDFAIAQSVFSHLPLPQFRNCLENLARHLSGACSFYVTVFIAPEDSQSVFYRQPFGGVITSQESDPYHYSVKSLFDIVADLPWEPEFIGDWGHPRNQKLMFYRLPVLNK